MKPPEMIAKLQMMPQDLDIYVDALHPRPVGQDAIIRDVRSLICTCGHPVIRHVARGNVESCNVRECQCKRLNRQAVRAIVFVS